MEKQRVVFAKDGMEFCQVRRDIVYKCTEDEELKLDLYYPADYNGTAPLPAVIFAHGEAPWEILYNAKDWGQYTGWGQLAAASGMVGITFTRRPSEGFTKMKKASGDIKHLFQYVSEHAQDFGVDVKRLALWVCSAGGPAALSTALHGTVLSFKAVAALYTLMNLTHIDALKAELDGLEARYYSPVWAIDEKSPEGTPPIMVVRAGKDNSVMNQSIDEFVMKCFDKNLDITVMNHQSGRHGFDVRDDTAASRHVIANVLAFLQHHLHVM